ncbi:hypothetical protein H6P81_001271 [Aristolochia fimbriata]|uniref:ARM repeat superfamily protein n=1 Tax=Aristolochia fimbriata TaxID=158543 RepID=A0AAV7F703_ARIFI|nr:hypothetical protein H6P81_001271 [Aristolochia fimbriata]
MASIVLPNCCKLKTASKVARSLRSRSISTVRPMFLFRRGIAPRIFLVRASSDGNAVDAKHELDKEVYESGSNKSGDAYVGLFVGMLGIDNDPLDREEAVLALWKYSQGGKQCIDAIMKFRGCVNLIINLLKSDSSQTCEAAAALLQTLSSDNSYRDLVAESGVIEELSSLLNRPSLTAEIKEQSICALWNLSVSEELRVKIANMGLIPVFIKSLDDDQLKVKEAAGGVLANLSLSSSNHAIMVEAGIIKKLAELLSTTEKASNVLRQEAMNILLELAKDEFYKILIVEEGLVLVPLIGAAAYKSFRPTTHAWPSLPDGTEIQRSSSTASRYGASELLLGLNLQDSNPQLDEAKVNAVVGRTHQQFLARIGAIELEDGTKPQANPSQNRQFTLLPWVDGIARLVLILELEDDSAVERAAVSIADTSINEHMRTSFKEAGAVKNLVELLGHSNESVIFAAAHALERLSISYEVCKTMEVEGVVDPLVDILKNTNHSVGLIEKAVNILARIFDPNKAMKSKFYVNGLNASEKAYNGVHRNSGGVKELVMSPDDFSELRAVNRGKVSELPVISRLIEILESSSADLQMKAASILEYLSYFELHVDIITSAGIELAIRDVFRKKSMDAFDEESGELSPIEAEEAGRAISATSQLLAKLLDSRKFCESIDSDHFNILLRKLLKFNIPLEVKESVAACLVKLESLSGSLLDPENPINKEVILYETIPRLVERLKSSLSPEEQEASAIELKQIVSKGAVEYTRAVAAEGAIFPLVKLVEDGSERASEAGLSILYNLSMDSENHPAIIAAGAVPVLRRIVLSEGQQWRRALHLLRTLPT